MRLMLAILLIGCGAAWASVELSPTTRPSASSRLVRPGWRLVDGRWAQVQAKVGMDELVRLVDEDGRHLLKAQPAPRLEPLLRNWRTSVIELENSDYTWKLSCTGRIWDDRRADGTQHLQLITAIDNALADTQARLTKIEITPNQSSIQAALVEPDGRAVTIFIVLSRDFTELATARFGQVKADLIYRARTARELLRDHPSEARAYLVPVMRLLSRDPFVLQPAAGDVYRVFDDLPLDDAMEQTIRKLIPDLCHRDAEVRRRGSRELASLGRRGVQAALRTDRAAIPPEAADRIIGFIQANTPDDRSVEQLRRDSNFLFDCLADPDPNVRAAAGKIVQGAPATRPASP